jgi:hypothetical protein
LGGLVPDSPPDEPTAFCLCDDESMIDAIKRLNWEGEHSF